MKRHHKRPMGSAISLPALLRLYVIGARKPLRDRLAGKYRRDWRKQSARMSGRYMLYHWFRPYHAANSHIRSKR
jgi:hypothetical protein